MGKFEKKVRKSFRGDIEEFDVWFAKNSEKFPGFSEGFAEESEELGPVRLKKKKLWLLPLAFFLAAVCVVLCFLPWMMQSGEPSRFGDAAVYEQVLDKDDMENISLDFTFLSKITFTGGKRIRKTSDDSLVFLILKGELETERDYYFLTVQIEYNSYYDFVTREEYINLQEKTETNGFHVSYSYNGVDDSELVWYYLLSEKDGRKIYWEIHCFEESIEQFIEQMFTE